MLQEDLRVCITQPEHLPWLGHFDKLDNSDVVVFLDNVQFKRRHFESRNRIYTPNGVIWITVPVYKKGHYHQKIVDVEIVPSTIWKRKYLKALQFAYRAAPHFDLYYSEIADIIMSSSNKLADLNIKLIKYLTSCFFLKANLLRASEMPVEGKGSQLILNILQYLGCQRYFSGSSGNLDIKLLTQNGIQVTFQNFKHPYYKQLYEPFQPQMAAVDLLFNQGPSSIEILRAAQIKLL